MTQEQEFMTELSIRHQLLKAKIISYQREYLDKNNITNPTTDDTIRMRRAITSRLMKQAKYLDQLHEHITAIEN